VAAVCSVQLPAAAATYRIDDTGTIALEPVARLHWRELAPGRRPDSTLEGSVAIAVRLNLAQWLGRSGRIYLVLPEQPIGAVRAQWKSQGRLLSGEVTSGQRALVYAGPISTILLEETIAMRILADGDRLAGTHALSFHFEIDVD